MFPPMPDTPHPPPPRPTGDAVPADEARPSRERAVRWALATAAAVLAVAVLWVFARLVVFLVVGMVLAYLMQPVVNRMQGWGLARIPAIVAAFAVVLGGLGVLLTYLVPFLGAQIGELSQQVSPQAVMDIAAAIEERLSGVVPIRDGALIASVSQAFETLFQGSRLGGMVGSVVDLFTNLFYAVLVIPFVTFFFLKDGALIRHELLRRVPNRYFEVTLSVVEKVETNLGRYLRALLVQCLSVAALATTLLYVAGLDYALAVGLFTGLANTIPYLGPLMGALAGVLVGVVQTGDFGLVPGILVAMLITQAADNTLFQPFIFSRASRTHPLVILFVVLMGAQLAGILGMLLAIPLTTTVRVTVQQVVWSLRNYRILKTAP